MYSVLGRAVHLRCLFMYEIASVYTNAVFIVVICTYMCAVKIRHSPVFVSMLLCVAFSVSLLHWPLIVFYLVHFP